MQQNLLALEGCGTNYDSILNVPFIPSPTRSRLVFDCVENNNVVGSR